MGASLRAVGSLTSNSAGLRAAMMATWSAENWLVQIRLRARVRIGKRSFQCPQGDLKLPCPGRVLASPNPRPCRVGVGVRYGTRTGANHLVQLVLNG